jgi:monoamine oxidase
MEGGHETPQGRLLDGACRGYFGLETRLQSSLNLVYTFGTWLSEDEQDSKDDDQSVSVGPMQGSVRIAGGNQRLPQAIAKSLPEGCIKLSHRLVAIKRGSAGTVILSFTTPKGPLEVTCEHVILTLPFSTLRRVDYAQAGFDSLKQAAITELGYGTISKLFLQFDARYWYQDGLWPRDNNGFYITDLDIQTLWDGSIGQTGSHGLLVNYTSGERGASYAPDAAFTSTNGSEAIQQYAQDCLQQLESVFPGISAHYTGTAALSYSTGDPNLLGSYACWRVGQYTLFGGYEGVRQGPIHFAGEHCSIKWQGFMEGAAIEGARAAREILGDYGVGD